MKHIHGFYGKGNKGGLAAISDTLAFQWNDFENSMFLGGSQQGGAPEVAVLQDARYALALAGEVFNEPELADGMTAPSQSQAILNALLRHGCEEGLRRIDGNFCLALWDKQSKSLLLARDPFGVVPLYYAFLGDTLAFSSTLSSFHAFPEFSGEIDMEALTAFIKFNFIPGSQTIYKQIKRVPAGGMLLKGPTGEPQITTYYDPVKICLQGGENLLEGSDEKLCDDLHTLLRQVVGRQFRASEKSAILLSGGVDSSLLLALLSEHGRFDSVTVGFAEKQFDERVPAAMVARHLGAKHTAVQIGDKDIQDIVDGLYNIYEEPFADVSQIPTTLAMRTAKRALGVDTVFVGDGGDEFFMGYSRHNKYMQWGIPADASSGRLTMGACLRHPRRYFMHLIFNTDIDYYNNWRANRLYRKTLLQAGSLHRMYGEMAKIHTVKDHLRRAMMFDAVVGIAGLAVVKCSRPADFYALNLRSPLLNATIFNLAQRLPERMLYSAGKHKFILRKLLDRYYPPQFFERPKAGFNVPLRDWLKGPLRDWAEEMISERKLREQGFFNPKFVRGIWEQESRHLGKLWSVFMFQAWLAKHGKGKAMSL